MLERQSYGPRPCGVARFLIGLAAAGTVFAAIVFPEPIAAASNCETKRPKIVGGHKARLHDWPGLAVLRLRNTETGTTTYLCGGSLIAPQWMLTAAHCVHDHFASQTVSIEQGQNLAGLDIVAGVADLEAVSPENVYPIERVVIHETYAAAIAAAHLEVTSQGGASALSEIPAAIGYDLALIRLGRPWGGRLARLSSAAISDPRAGNQVRVAGFGATAHAAAPSVVASSHGGAGTAGSRHLLETAVPVVAQQVCKSRYKKSAIGDGQICAGLETGGSDSCQGDSGGPLVARDKNGCPYQVGIVSWGEDCGKPAGYGVYTRVSAFAGWVRSHTGPLPGEAGGTPPFASANALSPSEIAEALAQLDTIFGAGSPRLSLNLRGGLGRPIPDRRLSLGSEIVFEAVAGVDGRLFILDVNALGETTLLFPNVFVTRKEIGRVRAGETVRIPADGYGFTAFRAIEPLGQGRLIALIAPPGIELDRVASKIGNRERGFAPVTTPTSLMMNLIGEIEDSLMVSARSQESNPAEKWGYATLTYEIVKP